MFEVKSFKELISLSKEKLDEAMAPVRSRAAKAKAALKEAEVDEKMITLESKIHEMCAKKDIDFDAIVDKMDEYDLLERKKEQVADLVKNLFPE